MKGAKRGMTCPAPFRSSRRGTVAEGRNETLARVPPPSYFEEGSPADMEHVKEVHCITMDEVVQPSSPLSLSLRQPTESRRGAARRVQTRSRPALCSALDTTRHPAPKASIHRVVFLPTHATAIRSSAQTKCKSQVGNLVGEWGKGGLRQYSEGGMN